MEQLRCRGESTPTQTLFYACSTFGLFVPFFFFAVSSGITSNYDCGHQLPYFWLNFSNGFGLAEKCRQSWGGLTSNELFINEQKSRQSH